MELDGAPQAATRRTRALTVSFLGAVVREMGDWMPIAGTIELLGQAGVDAPAVRTAVSRLKQRGWLESQARSGARGYALAPLALAALASGDEIIWHARQPADLDQGWCIVNFSVPESARAQRHRLRAHLASLGFGNVGTATWIAPARMLDAARAAVSELGLDGHTAMFVGAYAGGQDLRALLYDSWDLGGIDRRYREYVDRFAGVLDRAERAGGSGGLVGEQAFVTYLDAVDRWRKLPFSDPGLPEALLAEDWSAPAAANLFEQLVGLLQGPALAHAATYWDGGAR